MIVIRDDNQKGPRPAISMLPILIDWGVDRCNIKGCPNKPTTIIKHDEAGVFGMCEEHFQDATGKGKLTLEIEL